jgi:hypothetical protein
MSGGRTTLLILLAVTCSLVPANAWAGAPMVLAPPPGGQIYHAANPGFGGTENVVTPGRIHRFERQAGKHVAWAYFSNNWIHGVNFPTRQVAAIRSTGRVPFIRLMPRSSFREGGPDRRYTMESIIDGEWDSAAPGSDGLRSWCRQAAGVDGPLLAEFGTEVNGSWFPWNGLWNGGGRRDVYGDPSLADGPERFRDAYRHVVDVCRAEGAWNITWFFHVDVEGAPGARWNRDFANYYPGDEWVDWIGISDYGSLSPKYPWQSFGERLDPVLGQIEDLAAGADKPVALLETGVREDPDHPGRKAAWTRKTLRDIRTRYPLIRAISWWNERYRDDGAQIDIRLGSSPSALHAYRHGVANPAFTSRPLFIPR